MQSLSRFSETQVAGDGIEDPQLTKGDVFQLRKVEVKSLKI
jgi:hypothetical protein